MPRGLHNWRFVEIKRFLVEQHFQLSHVEGSHYFYVGTYDGQTKQVCIPFHGAKAIHPKTMKSIITQSGIPQKDWMG
jgi:predicted RNA binding protein YcfA (HicA-like mRNA interferase family)